MRFAVAVLAALLTAGSAHAQGHEHMHGDMAMPEAPPPANDPHAGHRAPPVNGPAPRGTPPSSPADHAADAYYDPAAMAAARKMLRTENGGMSASMILLDRLEYQARRGGDAYSWEGEGWFGGDIDRFAFKTDGEGEAGGRLERAELQALYSHAIDPWFNIMAGIRHDVRPGPRRSYAVIGIEGLAPYWFELSGELFLSEKGDVHARIEASYDQRLTQSLILQPQAELNFAAQDVPVLGVGSGLSDFDLGLRLRYEIVPEFAPYVGISWERRVGDSARYARLAGEDRSSTSFVAGMRVWF